MSFILRLFRGEKPPDDYETILATLATNIQKRQTLLSEIRLRERKATMLVTLYAILGWLMYLAFWYYGVVSAGRGANGQVRGAERALRALPVFVGLFLMKPRSKYPLSILFIRRIVQVWYNRKGNAEEKTLQTLLKEQRAKVEEIKKKTNYYSTRDLLSKYDGSAPNSPQQHGPPPQTPQRASGQRQQKSAAPSPLAVPPPPQVPAGPPQRKWYDVLADVLVGADDGASTPASQRYALICEKCFAHNGLVPEIAWADTQYTCPKCSHFNPSARSKRRVASEAASPRSPVSPVSQPMPQPMPPAGRPSVGGGGNGDARRRAVRGGDDGEMMEVDS
ncbi:hypothetical protein B0H10DRAFT_2075372 [Mycena sp. CBHHK59/15]|nr:hypothetical protein B0H10DRAFT_2075372 [Mycena sp. CBHHK59/15]